MRLAIVRQHYHPDGVVERVIERALEALLERNVAVSLYTRSWPRTRLQLIEPVICNPFFVGKLWRDWGFASAACHAIRRTTPSLVEAHQPMLCCDVYRAGRGVHAVRLEERIRHAAARERISLAYSPHSRYMVRAEARLYASPWLRKIICKSKMVCDEIHARFAVPEGKLAVIYNPVDSERFQPGVRAERQRTLERHGIAATTTVFLVICRDIARCAVAVAIEALATTAPPAHLIVVCRARDANRIRTHARECAVGDRVTTVDSHVDVRPYYGAADVFVLPSIYDPAPDYALEAMACALPVVSSTKSGVAELLAEHDCGFVFPSHDVGKLAAHMRALHDPAMRARLGENARAAVLPFSPAATTLALVLLYRDLLATTVPGAAPRSAPTGATGL